MTEHAFLTASHVLRAALRTMQQLEELTGKEQSQIKVILTKGQMEALLDGGP